MTTRSLKSIKSKVWIPPTYGAMHKLTVTRSDGTIDDLTRKAHFIEIEDGVTETIGKFEFELWNPNGTYTSVWSGNDIVRYYCDYATTATTLRFRGRIEKISKQNNKIRVTGRSEGLKFLNVNVTKQYTAQECSTILQDLVSTYGSGFTVTNVDSSDTNITVNWYEKNFWECVEEICTASSFFCYVDANLDFHFKEKGSVTNTGEAIVHGSNLINVGDFADDVTLVKNKIKVYGAITDGVQVIYTAVDVDSQTSYGIREEIVFDDNITDYNQAKDYADFLLADRKNPPIVGEVKGTLMATVQPGEKINVSSPQNGIVPQAWEILSFKNTIDIESGLFTTLRINKEPRKITHVFESLVKKSNRQQSTSSNPEQMEFSYNFLFDIDSGTHSDTEITSGVLKLESGKSSGTWVSSSRSSSSTITSAYLVAIGETLNGASFEVSANGGVNYESISDKSKITLTDTGKSLIVRVTLSNADTQIDSLSVQYK